MFHFDDKQTKIWKLDSNKDKDRIFFLLKAINKKCSESHAGLGTMTMTENVSTNKISIW